MRPNARHLFVAYAAVVVSVYLSDGPTAVVALALAVGWYFGYLHGIGLLRN